MQGARKTRLPAASNRADRVQMPIIPTVAGWISETPGTISLGQGVVHYCPPPAALRKIPAFLENAAHHKYLPDAGLPSLRKAFERSEEHTSELQSRLHLLCPLLLLKKMPSSIDRAFTTALVSFFMRTQLI